MKMATMRNRVRAGVLLTLSMVVPLLLVMTNATPALSQATVTVRVSNLDEPSDGYIGLDFDQEYAQSFCTGSVAVTLNKLRMYTRSNGSDSAPVVTIRSDRSGEPSSVLDTLTNPLIDGSEATAEDFTSSGYELDAATTYWVVVNRPRHTGSFAFGFTSSSAEDSETDSGWAIGDQYLARTDNSWSDFSQLDRRYVMRMAIYASGDSPSISSPAFLDSDCNGTIDSYEFSVNENATANTAVGSVTARDLDGDSLTYSVGGTDAVAFKEVFDLDASTGEITVKSGASIDYESDSSYSITVSATDGEDASGAAESEATTDATVSVRIRVTNLDEPGTVTLSQATSRVGNALLATLDDPDGWVLLSAVQWSRADIADGPFTVLSFKYISSPRRASYTPEAADEGKFLKVTLFYIDRQCRVVNSFSDQCRKMAETTSDNAVAAAQSDGETSMQQASNTPATGVPGITGTALAGETLTATKDRIEDEDGLTGAVFAYQWLVDGAEINGATDSSYTLVAADEGKPIEVRVTFTDDAGNEDSLTSNAVLAARLNSAATGAPTISGMVQVGQTLTASTSGISDSDGLTNATFTYQWLSSDGASDSDISGASISTYTLVESDEGKTIKVRVSFADDRSKQETLTSTATAAVAARLNSAATGAPTISGMVQVGQTLTASTSGISDSDGLTNATFTYQWLSSDGASDSDISGASISTYTLVESDEGKTIKVRVSFADDRSKQETLTSTATAAVAARLNSAATGAPTISGMVQVGQTLTASTSGISDSDGLTNATFTYQWLSSDGASDSDISGASISTYTLVESDEGKTIKVRVSFADDRGHQETLTSTPTVAAASAPSPLTGTIHGAPGSHNGQAVFKFELRFSEDPKEDFSYKTLRDHAFTVTGGTVTGARRLVSGKNLRWEITVQPSGNADVTVELPATTNCAAQGAICTAGGSVLSSPLTLTVNAPEATPPPAIVESALTVSVESAPTSHNGSDSFRIRIAFSEAPKSGFSYTTMRDHAFTVTGGSVTGARRLVSGKNLRWEIVVSPDSNGDVTITLPATTDCDAQGAICADGDKKLSNRLELTVSGSG